MARTLSPSSKAQCCWALANSYSAAAKQLLLNPSGNLILPIVFLLGHSLELHMKAFLISHGVSDKKLRNELSHNLIACFRKSRSLGLCQHLSLSKRQVQQIIQINRYYQEKQLEYFSGTAKRFGSMEDFCNTVEKISRAVFNPITAENFRALSPASKPER